MSRDRYTPALGFSWLTGIYDPLVERWMAAAPMRRAVVEALDLGRGLRLLELGCGPGRLAIEIKRRWPDVVIDALDRDPAILKVARRNAAAAGVAISFSEADITNLSAMGRYDRVYSTLVFHHLSAPGKRAALAVARRVLVPGGHVVIADFGRPADALQRLLFTAVGWADGAENTRPHRDGGFDQALRDTFGNVRSTATLRTMFGTVRVFVCRP